MPARRPARQPRPGGRRPRRPVAEAARPAPTPRGLGGEQVEGRQAVRELLAAGRRRVREVWFADDLDPAPILGEIEDLAGAARVRVQRVPRKRLDGAARSEAPQGVLARAEALEDVPFDALCAPRPGGVAPFLVGLDGVTDPQNLGTVLRTAECAGATGVVLPRHRAVHVTPTVAKAAAGAIERVPIALVPGLPGALQRARDLGVWTLGLDAGGTRDVWDLELVSEPVLVVLGAEGAGLGRLTRSRCDVLARIPLSGALASLNVAAAAAVTCFEVARMRRRGVSG